MKSQHITQFGNEILDCTGKPIERLPDVVRASTSAVIFDGMGQVLLQKRSDNGWWGLPGGAMDPGESFDDCVVREVFEETGLLVAIKSRVKTYSDPRDFTCILYPDGQIVQYVTALYICGKLKGYLKLSEESTDIGYFPTHDFPENTLHSAYLRVQDAVEFLPHLKMRQDL